METEERHRLAKEWHTEELKAAEGQHTEALKVAEEWEEELRRQLATVKVIVEKPGGAATTPVAGTPTFWAQPFSEEIDETAIPQNFREVVIETFDRTQDPHTHLQAFQTQIDLATSFASQFAANKMKRLEVADLFDIRQNKGEALKSYLTRFNNATVRVSNPDQKIFVKAFQKGLRAGQFSDSLALRKPLSMKEIRSRVEKHIEVEEDQADRLKAER
ncbi:hypothetical protein CR513_19057, partial [Mucuna pruriens]